MYNSDDMTMQFSVSVKSCKLILTKQLYMPKYSLKMKIDMKETIAKINEVMAVLEAELAKAAEGNKAAAARARKATLELEKLGKEFRKQSIAELK